MTSSPRPGQMWTTRRRKVTEDVSEPTCGRGGAGQHLDDQTGTTQERGAVRVGSKTNVWNVTREHLPTAPGTKPT